MISYRMYYFNETIRVKYLDVEYNIGMFCHDLNIDLWIEYSILDIEY